MIKSYFGFGKDEEPNEPTKSNEPKKTFDEFMADLSKEGLL